MPKDPKWGKNWETPDGVDFGKLRWDLKWISDTLATAEYMPDELWAADENVVQRGQAGRWLPSDCVVVIVEGFLLFFDKPVCDMFHSHIWVEADCDTCLLRRHNRGRGSRKRDVEASADWFRGQVWAHHEENRGRQLANAKAALRMEGAISKQKLADKATVHCKQLLREFVAMR
mmetsp:Transcript_69876/g.194319  ORF Transcript_69876/g.194319 Transcript_69876/m.194319 type:complete len:174 (+) Transcript_69876:3-524(+)